MPFQKIENIFKIWLLTGFILVGLPAAQLPVLKPEPISLKPESLKISPTEFYIAGVKDERGDKKAVASLIIAGTNTKNLVPELVDLQGGAQEGIQNFVKQSVQKNTAFRPVIIRLKECKITETPAANGRVDGKVTVHFFYDIQRAGKTLHTLEYKGGARYNRTPQQLHIIEPTLRQSLVDAINYLNTWMNREADRSEKLATGLQMHIKDVVDFDADTVFYDVKRPLTWDDFRGRIKTTGPSAAAIFPGFSFDGWREVRNGIIHVYLDVEVYMVKDNSWVKAGRDAYGLNHEQRHFDIVKIVAERFKQRVQPKKLTVEDYNDIIAREFFVALEEIKNLQEQYDRETRHSLEVTAQENWNRRIDADLRAFAVIK